jgi:hypothetical protein
MKMKRPIYTTLLIVAIWLTGCSQARPGPASTNLAEESGHAAAVSAGEERGNPIAEEGLNGGLGVDSDAQESFADTSSMQFARMMFFNFLVEVEGMSDLPSLFEWQPERLERKDDRREYLFSSGEWRLWLVEFDQPFLPNLLYRIHLSGPGLTYGADILSNGDIYPSQ